MKILFILFLLPVFSFAQTVHVKDEQIVYEGKEKIEGASSSEIFNRMLQALPSIISKYKVDAQSEDSIKVRGRFKLKTPYNLIRTVSYSVQLKANDNGYEYRIDSVSFTEQNRGEKAITKTSKEVLDNMDETGRVVGETEKLLNETDMRFQRLLDLLRSAVSNQLPVTKSDQ